jgi:hypothetical protein
MTKLALVNGLLLAFQTIRSHKLRAFLTVLGVIIGTGTIIGVSAILTGFDALTRSSSLNSASARAPVILARKSAPARI